MLLKALLVNDTSEYHHGSRLVIDTIVTLLRGKGISVSARLPNCFSEQEYNDVLKMVPSVDIVIINGEGTLHHNSEKGVSFLGIGQVASSLGIPVALINATIEKNPLAFYETIRSFDLIAVRESLSLRCLSSFRKTVLVTGDISLNNACLHSSLPRSASSGTGSFAFTDSVRKDASENLWRLACKTKNPTFPTLFPSPPIGERLARLLRGSTRKANKYDNFARFPMYRPLISRSYHSFAKQISESRLLVTGRFHAVCFAIKVGIPFIAVESNTYKIEGMLADAGLECRSLDSADLSTCTPQQYTVFTQSEVSGIAEYLRFVDAQVVTLFNLVYSLASHRSHAAN